MPSIHALLCAINRYPNPAHSLAGCINDLNEMKTYLEAFSHTHQFQLQVTTLTNEKATRARVIEALENLSTAKDGDQCLFFYAGHGSRCKAPQAFWHLEPDRMNESLVCWDSRLAGGRDLFDKELSYLIWKVTHGKKVNFISITDCCHSGSNMRLETVGIRQAEKVDSVVAVEDYYGFEYYEKTGVNQFTPPRGRYIHLAASQSHETAKEIRVGHTYRGVFSFLLFETLKGTRHPISYIELINRVRYRMKNLLPNQYPLLETTDTEDKHRRFLHEEKVDQEAPFLISYNSTKGWIINAGAFNGLKTEQLGSPYRFKVEKVGRIIEVNEVFADHSTVRGMDGLDTRKIYSAQLIYENIPRLPLAWAPGNDPYGSQVITATLQQKPSASIEIIPDIDYARYLIHVKENAFYLSTNFNQRPLFKPTKDYTELSAEAFLTKIEKVANWIRLQELNHAASKLQAGSLNMKLYQVKELGVRSDDAEAVLVDWQEPPIFRYGLDEDSSGFPGFKFLVHNIGIQPIWVSVFYLGIDFSIDNVLMPLQRLSPGEDAWCSYLENDHNNRNIPIKLHDTYHSSGLTRATNYLKVVVSNSEFNADIFNQTGLELQRFSDPKRTLAVLDVVTNDDWFTRTIPISIFHPLPSKTISKQYPFLFFGHELTAPEGFKALVRPTTLLTAKESLLNFPAIESETTFLRPVELGPLESSPQLSVLQFENNQGAEKVTQQHPLELNFGHEMINPQKIHPYGLNPKTNRFFMLNNELLGSTLKLQQLPPEINSQIWVFLLAT